MRGGRQLAWCHCSVYTTRPNGAPVALCTLVHRHARRRHHSSPAAWPHINMQVTYVGIGGHWGGSVTFTPARKLTVGTRTPPGATCTPGPGPGPLALDQLDQDLLTKKGGDIFSGGCFS